MVLTISEEMSVKKLVSPRKTTVLLTAGQAWRVRKMDARPSRSWREFSI